MSWASQTGPSRRFEAVEGGYNLGDGLRAWRQAMAYSKGRRDLVGAGGVDVLAIGDSILAGAGSNFLFVDKMLNRLRQLLQSRFNASDVPGGYGFLPSLGHPSGSFVFSSFAGGKRVNGADTEWTRYGPNTIAGAAGLSKGICLRHHRIGSSLAGPSQTAEWIFAKDMRIQHGFQASSTAQNRTMRQAQAVYQTNPGDGRFRLDFGPFSGTTPPYAAAQAGAVTVDAAAAESVGQRSAIINVEATASATHYVQLEQLDANDPISFEGLLLYCDDVDQGIRLHDLTIGGAKSGDYNDPVTLAGLARFGTGEDQSRNARLVMIGLGTNDCGNTASPALDLAAYRENLETLIAAIQGWPSRPSILLWYPPCQDSANAQARYGDYIAMGKALCDSHDCALLDFWAKTGHASHGGNGGGGYMFDRGFYFDGIHYSDKGQDWMAHETFGALCLGL
jgi:lysophospholipase L1-like esterase